MKVRTTGRRLIWLSLLLSMAGCGYRLASDSVDIGSGQTLAIPVFGNQTTDFGIEQRLTDAVRRELIQRTHYRVTPAREGDVVLEGEVLAVTAIPIIFNEGGRGTTYSVAVDVSVMLRDVSAGTILFQNSRWTFREVFEVSNVSEEFVPEDAAAIERLGRQFAGSLVASVFHTNP
jgi:hypothetical protein